MKLKQDPDTSSTIIGAIAPLGVVIGYFLHLAGINIPTEVQIAFGSLVFFALSYYVGKPSKLSRKTREVVKEYLPEAPLNQNEVRELEKEIINTEEL